MNGCLVEVCGVTKRYRRGNETVVALDGVGFRLEPGQLVGLVGRSGAGKSTLLNVLMGWERPDEGSVSWSDGSGGAARAWGEVAVVPQRLGLLQELTVAENARLPLRLSDGGPTSRAGASAAGALADALGLDRLGDRRPTDISLGEQQRVAVARALLLTPRLLLADEPTRHQDEVWRDRVVTLLAGACGAGTTTVVATHDEAILDHADVVLTLRDGRLAFPTR